MRAIVVVVLIMLLGFLPGCGATVRGAAADAPRIATPIVVDEALKAGEDAQTRQRFERVLDTPEMVAAIRDVVHAAVASALREATGESKPRLEEMSEMLAAALSDHLRREVVPALVASVKEEMSAEQIHRLTIAIAAMAAAATRAAMREASNEIPETVAPAVRTSIAQELSSPELRDALRSIASDMAHEAVMSSQRAMNEETVSGGPGLFDRMRRMLTLSLFLALASGVLSVTFAAHILRMRRRAKRYRKAIIELIDRLSGTKVDDAAYSARMRRMIELIT